MDNEKFNLGVIIGIIALTLSMIIGLLGDMRLETILIRSFTCFAISTVLCFVIIISIEKFSTIDKSIQNEEDTEKSSKNERHSETDAKTL